MKTIEIISWENVNENQHIVDLMEDFDVEDILSFFESDPDILTINGNNILFIDFLDKSTNTYIVVYVDASYKVEENKITDALLDFYNDKFYHCDSIEDKKTSIQYRGGKGYFYRFFTNDK